jgi:hypothetical protein
MEYGRIQSRLEEERVAELERTRKFFETKTYTGIPVPTKKQENKDHFGQNTEDKLVEWEKNQVKELFAKYDAQKKGVTKEVLVEIMAKLINDECIIGKVPNLTKDEASMVFESWKPEAGELFSWYQFRDGLNTWLWRL